MGIEDWGLGTNFFLYAKLSSSFKIFKIDFIMLR